MNVTHTNDIVLFNFLFFYSLEEKDQFCVENKIRITFTLCLFCGANFLLHLLLLVHIYQYIDLNDVFVVFPFLYTVATQLKKGSSVLTKTVI